MGKGKTKQQPSEDSLGQHLALSVAAHLARTQLVPEPLRVPDAQQLSDMLDVVASALAKVAPLYVDQRALTPAELEGAVVKRGATFLVLQDGRSLSAVSIKRADLGQAVAILKAVGIPTKSEAPKAPARDRAAELRAQLAEIETLLRMPLVPAQVERADALLVSIARNARQGRIANLAMRVMSAIREAPDDQHIGVQLARLLQEAESPEQ